MNKKILILTFVVIVGIQCTKKEDLVQTGNLKGKVTYLLNLYGDTLSSENIKIKLKGTNSKDTFYTTTDKDGNFIFSNVPADYYEIEYGELPIAAYKLNFSFIGGNSTLNLKPLILGYKSTIKFSNYEYLGDSVMNNINYSVVRFVITNKEIDKKVQILAIKTNPNKKSNIFFYDNIVDTFKILLFKGSTYKFYGCPHKKSYFFNYDFKGDIDISGLSDNYLMINI